MLRQTLTTELRDKLPSLKSGEVFVTETTELLAVPLDPAAIVATWSEQIMRPEILKRVEASLLERWHWSGRVSLAMAIHSWRWNQENLGKTFADSIWIVGECWVFPVGFDVPQDWQNKEK